MLVALGITLAILTIENDKVKLYVSLTIFPHYWFVNVLLCIILVKNRLHSLYVRD